MYESLTRKDKNVISVIQPLENKIDKIDKNLSKLIDNKTIDDDNKLSFDLTALSRENNLDNLESIQNKIEQLLNDIIKYEFWNDYFLEPNFGKRVYFDEKITIELAKPWLDSLKKLTQSFKWSKSINCLTVFHGFPVAKYDHFNNEIPYKTIFELFTIYNNMAEEEKIGLTNTVVQRLNENYEEPKFPIP